MIAGKSILLTLVFFMSAVFIPGYAQNSNSASQTGQDTDYLLFMEIPTVTTSTQTEKNSIKAPSTTIVVTQDEIKNMGASSVMDLLNRIPGIIVERSSRGFQIISLRGIRPNLFSDKIKLMINGHSISEATLSEYNNYFYMGLENVERVEILKGPGSCLYGTNAFAGIINIITQKPSDINGVKADAKRSSFNTTRADLTIGTAKDDMEIGANYNYMETDGVAVVSDSDRLSGAPFSNAPSKLKEDAKTKSGSFNFKYKNLSINGIYSDLMNTQPIGQVAITEDHETTQTKYGFIEAKYDLTLSDKVTLKTTVSYDQVDLVDKGQIYPDGFVYLSDVNHDGIYEMLDTNGDGIAEYFQNGCHFSFGLKSDDYKGEILLDSKLSDSITLLFGIFGETVETNDLFIKSDGHPLYGYTTHDVMIDYSSTYCWQASGERDIYGAFVQGEWDITDEWYFVLGGRYDDYNDFGSSFNPRTGIVWDFNHKGGLLKLSYGTAFKAPNFTELYNQNNPSLIGNTELNAEELDSLELSLNYIFSEKLMTSLSVYQIKTKDLIDASDTRDYTKVGAPKFFENKGKYEILGSEFEARYFFKEKCYLFASYTYTQGENKETDLDIPWIPEHQLSSGLNIHFMENFNWNIDADYVGKREREASDPRPALDETLVTNTTLRMENIKGFDIYMSVFNIFDETTYSPAHFSTYPESDLENPGISYLAGASYKY